MKKIPEPKIFAVELTEFQAGIIKEALLNAMDKNESAGFLGAATVFSMVYAAFNAQCV